ncbi:primase C-terminal domain-containing protein [Mammaliicoccus sciuri]|uniref:primase C-terminal domain-containing protein n=1 Tax=Mammaliicoccus sciuri TaxID=1296 RepID=UPI002DC00B99|nr:primase C-terminal domain-containing protein [Mammaliicoccus sciuri]MEB7784203.1 primase C-terminal domain-containing protein [Mammaliicoccus sciuri]
MVKNKKSRDQAIFDGMLHNGLSRNDNTHNENSKKCTFKNGKVIVTKTKEDLSKTEGKIIDSFETFHEMRHDITHMTPNVFRSAYYTKEGKFAGHLETNLKQINVFAIDIDGVDKATVTIEDIIARGHDKGIKPTLIMDTPNGYHVMFYLKSPIFMKNTGKKALNLGLDRAKRVSMNLRTYYAEVIEGIDINCNHFGFFRVPRHDNVVYFNDEHIYDFQTMIDFSMNFELTTLKNKYNEPKTVQFKQLKSIHEPWFHHLYNATDIAGEGNGIIARDNAVFTMALHMYASNMDKSEALAVMNQWNQKLKRPLDDKQVEEKVNSAYSGRYKGASKKHIMTLLYTWCEKHSIKVDSLFFRKHRKSREQRQRVHYSEWKQDLYQYIQKNARNGIVKTTRTEICKALGMSKSTLKALLKDAQTFYSHTTKGKYAVMYLATRKTMIQEAMKKVRGKRVRSTAHLKMKLNRVFKKHRVSSKTSAFIDTTIQIITEDLQLEAFYRKRIEVDSS